MKCRTDVAECFIDGAAGESWRSGEERRSRGGIEYRMVGGRAKDEAEDDDGGVWCRWWDKMQFDLARRLPVPMAHA